jgi:ribosomal protein L40E
MICKAKNPMKARRCIHCGGKLYVEGVVKTK